MEDSQPEHAQPPVQMERIRHLPDWETPINPPKRPLFSRSKLTRSLRRSRLGAAFRLRPAPAYAPNSDESLNKETAVVSAVGILPTTRTSILHAKTAPVSPHYTTARPRFSQRLDAALPPHRTYFCGLTRRTLLLFVLLPAICLLVLAVALGVGLGLGLRRHSTPDLPLPDGGKSAHEGDLTYFSPALGACGYDNTDNDAICAVAHELFDAAGANAGSGGNPNANPLCGQRIRITRQFVEDPGRGNVTVDVTVVDRCTGCQPTDLDLSPSVFNMLAPEVKGRVVGDWRWL